MKKTEFAPQNNRTVASQNRTGLLGWIMSHKIETQMSHKSDSLSKIAFVVQTAKPDDEQNRAYFFHDFFEKT
jgi:hypothetical protein